jgi:hypothetical protein
MHALALHLIDQIDQPFHAATEPIQLPDHEGIGFTQVRKGLFKPRAIGLGTAKLVGENAFAPRFLERVELLAFPTDEAYLFRHYTFNTSIVKIWR